MKIIDAFLDNIHKMRALQKQRELIRTTDDSLVIESLPLDEDNSSMDIKEIVRNMESQKNRAEVVENNLQELISQDNVRDTLRYLNDEDKELIVRRHNNELKKQEKLINAIESIRNNKTKLELTYQNLHDLSDFELCRILSGLVHEEDKEKEEKKENAMVKIISKKIVFNMIKFGSAWHLKELTDFLNRQNQKAVFDCCLTGINQYEKSENAKFNGKHKLIMHFYSSGVIDINEYRDNGMLTQEEVEEIEKNQIKEIERKSQNSVASKINARKNSLKRSVRYE